MNSTYADTVHSPTSSDGVSGVADVADTIGASVADAADDVASQARDADRAIRRFVVERPFVALAAAVTGGFLLGRLLQRL
jgi:ElaB/YqjD/DUF883 family membrane-anchored ribosome-binding protein